MQDGNHEVSMFNDLPWGDFSDEAPSLPEYFRLPPAKKAYIGRGRLQVSQHKNRCVSGIHWSYLGRE